MKNLPAVLCVMLIVGTSAVPAAPSAIPDKAARSDGEYIACKLDGRAFRFAAARLVVYDGTNVEVEGTLREKVDCGAKASPRWREAEATVLFRIAAEGGSLNGTHSVGASDMVPIYFAWYSIERNGEAVAVAAHTADLDTPAEGQSFSLTIEDIGKEGALVKGRFSGVLMGDDGRLHTVEEGEFLIRRRDAKE